MLVDIILLQGVGSDNSSAAAKDAKCYMPVYWDDVQLIESDFGIISLLLSHFIGFQFGTENSEITLLFDTRDTIATNHLIFNQFILTQKLKGLHFNGLTIISYRRNHCNKCY